ncbi:uncharacterized protein LOC103312417 [Tribolium castaneum]|uniref:MSP domain-containing protein n=1 Tax=Tribolium castaneum TaxID=7070 RepID=D6WE93_TRICA|nr:PREDICTED: uncharacterized protein LOC103312417 [Tribolium castaneum]EFA01435.2 hypothetical protein TcasGA2_TC030648 [Tribolium castaneum]|eukprot:XP_008191197.1 PREDICTED: uncharacterized protein LOC103312417 [Tribolium castaneum]
MAHFPSFDDKTILKTPQPVHSSSMAESDKKISTFDSSFEMDNSLGILSIKSGDLSPHEGSAAFLLQQQINLAKDCINKHKEQPPVTSIPSRYLRPSEQSANSIPFNDFSSTINESDLLGNSSTPRASACTPDLMRDRCSIGKTITALASSFANPSFDVDKIFNTIHKTMEECSFKSGEIDVAKLLEEDEKSWRREKAIPTETKDFSVTSDDFKMSIGSFFQKRSDELPELLAKSPDKREAPIPLIETSTRSEALRNSTLVKDETVSLSLIQKMLSSEESPMSALDNILNKAKMEKKYKACPEPTKARTSPPIKLPTCQEEKEIEKDTPVEPVIPTEPFNGLEEIKENISPFDGDRTAVSSRSSSSLSSLPNGKLPIATTKTEVIWGCTKPGKNSLREFVVRNRSASRVGITCTVSNPSFRLHKDGSELNFTSVLKVILHPYESRPLCVTFAPTAVGAVVDNITFTPIDPSHVQTTKQFIKLYGYGGYADVVVREIVKDTTGKFLCPLGSVDDQELKRGFFLRNNGTLPAFAHFNFTLNGFYSFSNVEVEPLRAVLMPGEEREVTVKCNLSKKDLTNIKSKTSCVVFEMGKLLLVHGAEVDRARLRKLYQKAKEREQQVKPWIVELVEKIHGEVVPKDLKYFRESLLSIEDVVQLLNKEEITLTVEQEADRTVTLQHLQDETAAYLSLCEQTEIFDCTTCPETCQVEPSKIFLTLPEKVKDIIFVTNRNKKTIYFETNVVPEGLKLKPHDGTIKPGETVMIEVSCKQLCKDKTAFKVRILVDNESFSVDVKVVYLNA